MYYICHQYDNKCNYMILSIIDYQLEFHPTKSTRTVLRMVKGGLMPSNHIIIKGFNNPILIQVIEDKDIELHYYPYVVDFLKNKVTTHETAAYFCCENNLNMKLFCKLAKLK
ncbi:MAG TPA: hypothetical protein DCS19_07935 [Flavobacterium sp.]|nr:hypothetical protein [Flavobacterium sp.]